MLETVQQDEKQINLLSAHKKQALILYGYLDADEDYYKAKQNKIVVLKPKISISQPKGDIEMKNITYRPKEKRYIGRKQLLGHTITVYAKTQKECSSKLNAMIRIAKQELIKQPQPTGLSFVEYWDRWYQQNKAPFIADTTRADFEILKRKLEPIHQIKLKQLDKNTILNF